MGICPAENSALAWAIEATAESTAFVLALRSEIMYEEAFDIDVNVAELWVFSESAAASAAPTGPERPPSVAPKIA